MKLCGFIKCIFSLFSLKRKTPKKVVVVFPGFGLYPKDYEEILPKDVHKIYLNIWTDNELQTILDGIRLKTIGLPGTASYEEWFTKLVNQSKEKIVSEMKKYGYTLPKTIYFGHSIGTEIAQRLLEHADGIITYGGIVKGDCLVKTKNLLGTDDKMATKFYESWPKNAFPIEKANHFSCVSEVSKRRSIKWRKDLGIPAIYETQHSDDKRYIIKREIEWFVSSFV